MFILAVVIQIALAKLGVGLMLQCYVFLDMGLASHYNGLWKRRGEQSVKLIVKLRRLAKG